VSLGFLPRVLFSGVFQVFWGWTLVLVLVLLILRFPPILLHGWHRHFIGGSSSVGLSYRPFFLGLFLHSVSLFDRKSLGFVSFSNFIVDKRWLSSFFPGCFSTLPFPPTTLPCGGASIAIIGFSPMTRPESPFLHCSFLADRVAAGPSCPRPCRGRELPGRREEFRLFFAVPSCFYFPAPQGFFPRDVLSLAWIIHQDVPFPPPKGHVISLVRVFNGDVPSL